MSKSAALTLLPIIVSARGLNNGNGSENAFAIELLSNNWATLTLFSYNKDNEGTDEWHGDLEVTNYGTDDFPVTIYLQYGFCIQN